MTITPTFLNTLGRADGSAVLATWVLTTVDPIGHPVEFPEFSNFTWQYEATWGGATLAMQGSNSGNAYFTLTKVNSAGAAATATADGGVATNEISRYMRPNLTAVGAGATVTVTLVANRATPVRT